MQHGRRGVAGNRGRGQCQVTRKRDGGREPEPERQGSRRRAGPAPVRVLLGEAIQEGKGTHAIHEGVVELEQHRCAAALQPLDHVRLPEGTRVIQRRGEEHRRANEKLRLIPRRRNGLAPEMIVEIHVRILDPLGEPEVEGAFYDLLPQTRCFTHRALDHGAKPERIRRALQEEEGCPRGAHPWRGLFGEPEDSVGGKHAAWETSNRVGRPGRGRRHENLRDPSAPLSRRRIRDAVANDGPPPGGRRTRSGDKTANSMPRMICAPPVTEPLTSLGKTMCCGRFSPGLLHPLRAYAGRGPHFAAPPGPRTSGLEHP